MWLGRWFSWLMVVKAVEMVNKRLWVVQQV